MDRKDRGNTMNSMNPMNTINSMNTKGFSLIELLIAMLILFIGLIAVASMVSTAILGNANAKWSTIATTCAEEKIEELRSRGYTNIPVGSESDACPNPGFSRSWTVSVRNDISPGLKEINVTVTWQNNRQVNLVTYVAR